MQTIAAVDVLLVEDNPLDAEMTMVALGQQRMASRLEWVRDGEQALDYLYCRGNFAERQPVVPRLVLLDLKLPKVDGLEVLRVMKEDEKLQCVPVVMLTSSAEESDLVRSYGLGANSYVVKPIEFEKFNSEVSKLGFYWLLINHLPKTRRL